MDLWTSGGTVLAAIALAGFLLLAGTSCRSNRSPGPSPGDPLEAAYRLEGREVRLTAGRSEVEAAPGSAAKTVTAVVGDPIPGDLDGKDGPIPANAVREAAPLVRTKAPLTSGPALS